MSNLVPAVFQESIPASTRKTFLSERFDTDFTIENIRPAFAINTQRNLQLTVWVTSEASVLDNVRPQGINLFGGRGTRDYLVGDGEEGELNVPIKRTFPGGFMIAIEANNTNGGSSHTLDVLVEISDPKNG